MIFRLISLFLSLFSHIFTFLYISYLTLPTQKEIKERFVPPSSGTTATSLRLRFHLYCVLHLILRLLAIDLRPLSRFLSNLYRISIASYRIASDTAHCRIAHRDCL